MAWFLTMAWLDHQGMVAVVQHCSQASVAAHCFGSAEVLLARDASCVRYGPDGRPAKRAKPKRGSGGAGVKAGAVALTWSAPPAALGSSGPYAVGLTEQGAEARLLEPLTITGTGV